MANKVLIVDDEPFNLDLLEQELADQGYTVERAGDGEEALQKVGSFLPDVILLDYMMPRMNGIEACRAMRQHEATRLIPIILITTRGEEEYVAQGFAAGCNDYVTKPVNATELVAKVRALLGDE